jgi:hypothetical protein
MGVIPVNMHNAFLDVVRNALAIFIFTSRSTRMYFCQFSYCIASIQTGAPYSRRFSNAPLYMVCSALCLSPHYTLADLDNFWISFAHLSAA